MENEKLTVEETIVLKYEKVKFTMQNAIDDAKSKYEPCSISINDLDDQEYHIVTLNKL